MLSLVRGSDPAGDSGHLLLVFVSAVALIFSLPGSGITHHSACLWGCPTKPLNLDGKHIQQIPSSSMKPIRYRKVLGL